MKSQNGVICLLSLLAWPIVNTIGEGDWKLKRIIQKTQIIAKIIMKK